MDTFLDKSRKPFP